VLRFCFPMYRVSIQFWWVWCDSPPRKIDRLAFVGVNLNLPLYYPPSQLVEALVGVGHYVIGCTYAHNGSVISE
ncbi:hypothetical protein AVEN_150552-1, partial [Araneus ventricosus]